MQAQGQHLLVRKPSRATATDGGIHLPDNFDQTWSYGRVMSIGALAMPLIGDTPTPVEEGAIVLFDSMGAREVELHPRDDANLVMIHASQVYCTLVEAQLEKRKLPIP